MNIEEAKEEIRRAARIYLMKDGMGAYRIPVERQRPIFMTGAPGIGKTAVMEQLAKELDLALVSYSMTHHTRQSALGLPFIVHRTYDGTDFDVTEYTMSEIVDSVYRVMEKFETAPEKTVLVGDRLYTDIATAINADVTSICVLTGEATLADLEVTEFVPTYIFDSVREIDDLLIAE